MVSFRGFAPLASSALVGLAGLAGVSLTVPPALAAERTEIVRETVASFGETRFVTEQKVIHDDAATEDYLKTIAMETTLIVEQAGREAFRQEGWRWQPPGPELPVGTDVTGDGQPDAVFGHATGGAHCCFSTFIFELRDPGKPIVIETGNGEPSFQKRDGKPGYVIAMSDDNYSYWRSSFAASPFPQIVLTYQDGAYRADAELTRKPPPADAELQSLANAARTAEWTPPEMPGEFLATTMDLIYGGNLPQALRFIDLAWNPKINGKADFVLALFQCRLPRSAYWPTIATLNKLPATMPRADCEKIDRNIY